MSPVTPSPAVAWRERERQRDRKGEQFVLGHGDLGREERWRL